MKISGVKKIKPELIIDAFNDFKKEQISNLIHKFSYDDFIFFLNTPENQSKYHNEKGKIIPRYKKIRNVL